MQKAVAAVTEKLGDTGRILVRESGTEPVIRVMVEAPDQEICQKYVDEVVNVICERDIKHRKYPFGEELINVWLWIYRK